MTEQEFISYFVCEIADDDTNETAKEMLEMARLIISSREDAVNRYESIVMSIQRACEGTGCVNAHELRMKLDWAMTQIEMRVFKFNGHCPFCERTIWECNSNAVNDCEWKKNYYEARLKPMPEQEEI